MVAIKDFEMPHSCGGCMLRESSRLGRGEILHICSASGETILHDDGVDCAQLEKIYKCKLNNCPLVEVEVKE